MDPYPLVPVYPVLPPSYLSPLSVCVSLAQYCVPITFDVSILIVASFPPVSNELSCLSSLLDFLVFEDVSLFNPSFPTVLDVVTGKEGARDDEDEEAEEVEEEWKEKGTYAMSTLQAVESIAARAPQRERGREITGRRRPFDAPTATRAVRLSTYPERAGKRGK